jgi:hypothetical protein
MTRNRTELESLLDVAWDDYHATNDNGAKLRIEQEIAAIRREIQLHDFIRSV